jgi:PAS domain S-box-containing protein
MLTTLDHEIYRALFVGTKQGMLLVEGELGVIVDANAAAAALLGGEPEDLVGRPLVDLFPPDMRDRIGDTLDDLWDAAGVSGYGCRLRRRDGADVPVQLGSSTVVHDAGSYLAIVVQPNDEAMSAELRRVNADLRTALQEATRDAEDVRRAGRGRQRLVAQLTHALQTPLDGLIALSGALAGTDHADDMRRTAGAVASSARALKTLVDDVCDFALLDGRHGAGRRDRLQLAEVVQAVREAFAVEIAARGLTCEIEVDPNLTPWVAGDAGRLRQVLANLFDVVLRNTGEGAISLALAAVGESRVRFALTGTGCAIDAAELGRLLAPTGETPDVRPEALAGAGLGVVIAREFVAAMGGSLAAATRADQGTTFSFVLELPAAAEPPLGTADSAMQRERAVAELLAGPAAEYRHDLRVLLAEDNKVNQTVALGMMRKLGHEGTAVDDGRHALMTLASGDFDVVFMDLQMPELGGLETTRRIRAGEAGERNRDIPIVAMTGHATRQDRKACLAAGMNGYIAKPISTERITEALRNLSSPAPDTGGTPFSADRLVAQMNGDTELAAEILEVFREDTNARLDRINVALRNYVFEDVIQEARAIEGGALNVCAEAMVGLSRDLLRAAERKEHEFAAALVDDMAVEVQAMTLDGAVPDTPATAPV